MDMPTAEDYLKAVQQPWLVFEQPQLRAATFDVHPLLGIPVPASGTSAIVFKATVDGKSQALRFLTRPDAASQQRYTMLNRYFAEHGLTGDVATSQWMDDAITVNGRKWPMLRMQWVEGKTLNTYVDDLVEAGDTAGLRSLAGSWRGLVQRIQTARFAHGDLQHGNVMVEKDGTLRLVDFDSAWIDPFAGSKPPTESGHRNYQRPARPWGPWMDTFPGLVIYVSLLALARNTKAWDQLHNGENLLFRSEDFVPPHETQAWWQVAQLNDPQVGAMADRLKVCCAPTWSATTDLESLLAEPMPWWTRTRTAPVPQVAPAPQPQPVRRPVASGPWWNSPVPVPPPRKPRSWWTVLAITLAVWLVVAVVVLAVQGSAVAGLAAGLVPAAIVFAVLGASRKSSGGKP
jgi:eukaryotic-like serine/threonine-protein kinase